jgi:bifunctional DNase/RNase
MTTMIGVQIVGLQLDPEFGVPVILLAESDSPTRVLPILVGPAEAQSIALAVTGIKPARPGTHDLMATVLDAADCRLEEVAVTELTSGTFFAELFVETPAGLKRISSRPSDGIALAVRVGAPIVVNADVLEEAAINVSHEPAAPFSDEEIDAIVAEFQRSLATVQPSDFEADTPATPSTHPDDDAGDQSNPSQSDDE